MSVVPLKLDATRNLPRRLETGDLIDPVYVAPSIAVVTHADGDTLADSDAGKVAEMDGGTLTLDASVLTANNAGLVRQTGTTAVTVAAAVGTTIYPTGARTTSGQGTMLCWQVRSSTLAYVNGETA